jgi:hypothetical protein
LPLDRHFRANGPDGGPCRRVGAERTCPSGQPLIESFRPALHYSRQILCQSRKKGQ